jgi:hypothetical protein
MQHISTFEKIFMRLLEDMSAGSGGSFGDYENGGWTTSKDGILPKVLGKITARPGLEPGKPKKKRKKRKSKSKKLVKSSYRVNTGVDIRVISPKLTVR